MLKVEGIVCELNYLFCAIFDSGLTVEQTAEDRSRLWTPETPYSAWHDVAQALAGGEVLRTLALIKVGKATSRYIAVNFPELTFDVDDFAFRAHEGEEVFNVRPVYCRRRGAEIGMDGEVKSSFMRFRLGWQGNLGPEPGAKNIERILEIENV